MLALVCGAKAMVEWQPPPPLRHSTSKERRRIFRKAERGEFVTDAEENLIRDHQRRLELHAWLERREYA